MHLREHPPAEAGTPTLKLATFEFTSVGATIQYVGNVGLPSRSH
jgi:hypothetical protein